MDQNIPSRHEAALKAIVELADYWADTDADQWIFDAILDLAKKALDPTHVTDAENLQHVLNIIAEIESGDSSGK